MNRLIRNVSGIMISMATLLLPITGLGTDFYWRGSASSDNIDQVANWWDGSNVPSSGDNLYFNNSEGVKQPYCNYGSGAWFGYIIVNNGANAITWSGDTTWAYKFENNDSPDLFKIQSNIGNRSGSDLEINPVGSGGMQITGNVSINDDNKWLKIYGSGNLEISGVISGNPGVDVTIMQDATVTLSGANTWPDEFNIYGGTAILKNADPLDVSMINLGKSSGSDSATLQIGDFAGVVVDNPITVVSGSSGTKTIGINYGGDGEFSGDITLNDDLTLSGITDSILTMSGDISGAGKGLTVDTYGTVILSGNNTSFGGDSGWVKIERGTLKVSANGSTGANPSSTADYIFLNNWATLQATDSFTLNSKKRIVLSGNGKIAVDENKTLSYSGDITGAHQFAKAGLGTLELGTSSDFTDATSIYIDAGTLWTPNTQPLDASSATLYIGATSGSDPATYKLGSGSSTKSLDEPIIVRSGSSGTKTLANGNTAGNCNFNGKISLKDDLTVDASGGSTIIFGGGIDMSASGDHDLSITGADTVTIKTGAIEADTGACEINYNGTGVLDLAGDNATGVDNQMMINIKNTGTVKLSDANALGDAPTTSYPDKINFYADGVLSNIVDITLTSDAGVTIADGVTATFGVGDGVSDDLTINGVVSDAADNGQVRKTGPGTLYLYGANTYGGVTTVEGGTLCVNSDDSLGSLPGTETDGSLVLNGGTLEDSAASFTIKANRNIEIGANNGTISVISSRTLTINSKIKGSGTLTKSGSANLVLAGANTYSGKTIVEAGYLKISADSGLGAVPGGATPGHITLSGGTLTATEDFTLNSNRGIELSSDSSIAVNNNKTMTYAGIIAGTGKLTKSASGTLVLTGANTYSGGTHVDDGTLQGTTTSLQGDIDIDAGEDLVFAQDVDGTYADDISGGGDLTKSGSGTVTLSGTLSHTGTTTVDAGMLAIDGTCGSAITVNSGGTLGGSGTISGAVTLNSGGAVRGGLNGSPAILNTGSITIPSGANFNAEINGATAGTQYSQVDVTGSVTLGGTLNATLNYAPAYGAKFILIQNDGSDAVSGTFNGLAEGATVTLTYSGNTYDFAIHYSADSATGTTHSGNDVMLIDARPLPSTFLFR